MFLDYFKTSYEVLNIPALSKNLGKKNIPQLVNGEGVVEINQIYTLYPTCCTTFSYTRDCTSIWKTTIFHSTITHFIIILLNLDFVSFLINDSPMV